MRCPHASVQMCACQAMTAIAPEMSGAVSSSLFSIECAFPGSEGTNRSRIMSMYPTLMKTAMIVVAASSVVRHSLTKRAKRIRRMTNLLVFMLVLNLTYFSCTCQTGILCLCLKRRFLKGRDNWIELPVKNRADVIPAFFYAMICDSVLRHIICADFFTSVTTADL
jgi:hypothetical protein